MITRSSLLAIKALEALAGLSPGECEGAASIARKIDAPANYLGKVLQSLVSKKLVASQKGKGGGFRLGRSPKQITLMNIVENIEDVEKWSKCFLGRKQCLDASPCGVHEQWKTVREKNKDFLMNTTLYSLNHK